MINIISFLFFNDDFWLMQEKIGTTLECSHCHQECKTPIHSDTSSDVFCCYGCKVVFELLSERDFSILDGQLKDDPYAHLNHPDIKSKLLDFQNDSIEKISIHLPQIHCSSCIFLLENLSDIHEGVLKLSVNFSRKRAEILYDTEKISLSKLAALLEHIGYPPNIEIHSENTSNKKRKRKSKLLTQLGIAGFFFGNTMLLALPEYFSSTFVVDPKMMVFFRYLMLGFSLPVISFSARDYFSSSYKSLRAGVLSIDLPIAIGIITLFGQSLYEIISGLGSGYFDSLTGLIFFLLLGKWYQQKTYENFAFDRDYKSFLPLAATLIQGESESIIPIDQLKKGDSILVRQGELIPCDGHLQSAHSFIDYSYISGESQSISKKEGELIYAGGKIESSPARILVNSASNQSYLSSLWSKDIFNEEEKAHKTFTDQVSQYFTPFILVVALIGAIGWSIIDSSKVVSVFTSVLIVACPCALALSEPFTSGSFLRWFGRFGFYLKNSEILSKLSSINHLIFDKTGTLTQQNEVQLKWRGEQLSSIDAALIYKAAQITQHPLARNLQTFMGNGSSTPVKIDSFEEFPGEGICFFSNEDEYKVGKASFIAKEGNESTTTIYVQKNKKILGSFSFYHQVRESIPAMVSQLGEEYSLSVLSGDTTAERDKFKGIFGHQAQMLFEQEPADKLSFIKNQQLNSSYCLMLGDGLNDAGALKQSDVGISLCEDSVNYFPACDALLRASSLKFLPQFLKLSQSSRKIIQYAFVMSFIYNIVGLSFALSGLLSPLVSAILMPLSSVSVILFTTISARRASFKVLKRN